MKDAEIVAIGTEILLGDLVDTNAPWLSRNLAALGVAVHRHTTVGDDKRRIVATLSEAAFRAVLIVTVGGLGATPDDLTHECLGEVTSRDMVECPEARRHLDEVFERFTGRKPPPSAYEQTLFPEGSKLIPNPLGTATGASLEADSTLFVTFPGVPTEMERMFEETLEPLIRRHCEGIIVSQTLRLAGISEEELTDEVRDFLGCPDPTVTPLVGPGELGVGEVDIRVTTRALTREDAEKKMKPVVQEIISRLSGYYLGTVIDLGCGSALLARELAAADYGVLGIDISEALLNVAKERVATAHFRQESILKAELPPCAAVAAIGECFNYLFDEDNTEQALYALLRSIHEPLDPGGLLLFDVAEPGRVPGSGSQHAHTQGED